MLGAGLFAANLSTTFRLRKFGMADGATYPLMFQVTRPASDFLKDSGFCAPRTAGKASKSYMCGQPENAVETP